MTHQGVTFGQSWTIHRYVASQTGFLGTSALEAARIDNVVENIRELLEGAQKVLGPLDPPADKKVRWGRRVTVCITC
jgi:hypothetical protein